MYKHIVRDKLYVTIILMRKTLLIISLMFTLALTITVNAQVGGISSDDVNVNMIPNSPKANEQVAIRLTSYILDLDSSTITWQLNGKTEASGKGIKNFNFTTGDINTNTTVLITVRTKDGQTVQKTLRIKPTDVDLVWQSESYVPPFFKGKALFSHQNKITFIAIPHMTNSSGVEINPKNLIYKWTKNGVVMENDSGYGKNTFTFVSPLVSRDLDVNVQVTSPDTTSIGFARIDVKPTEPTLIIYRKNPLYGIEFQKGLTGNIKLTDSKEVVVIGIPFYFGATNTNSSDLVYKWSINGVKIDNGQNTNMQVFRQKEGTSGVSNISLSIENTDKILQLANNKFNLEFGETITNTSSF